jgi:hypothetical protein
MHRTHPFRSARSAAIAAAALPAFACVALASNRAQAATVTVSGTPQNETTNVVIGSGIQPGAQVEGNVGSGFSDTYNIGFGARLGFTTSQGIYLGGNLEHYIGKDVAGSPHNTFLGGEAGLKIFPTYRLEVRPYAFLGAQIPSNAPTSLAFAPGIVGAYHFGSAFVDVDARYIVTPESMFTLTGGIGVGF